METSSAHPSIEVARNEAVRWLEAKGVVFGPRRVLVIGRLGSGVGREVGVAAESGSRPWWRLRLDFDPEKGAHFNVEWVEGGRRDKHAFRFPGGEGLVAKLLRRREPRG